MYIFERLGYTFKYFFDCDVDELGHIDVEGFDVYEDGELIAELDFVTADELEEMSDAELIDLIDEYSIDSVRKPYH